MLARCLRNSLHGKLTKTRRFTCDLSETSKKYRSLFIYSDWSASTNTSTAQSINIEFPENDIHYLRALLRFDNCGIKLLLPGVVVTRELWSGCCAFDCTVTLTFEATLVMLGFLVTPMLTWTCFGFRFCMVGIGFWEVCA